MNDWMHMRWLLVIGYGPSLHILSRRQVGFTFRSEEDTQVILGMNQFQGSTIFHLKPWYPYLDPRSEIVWVNLLGLPVEFWTNECIKALRDLLGKNIMVDQNYKIENRCLVAKVLVEINIVEGLYESLDIIKVNQCLL